MKKAMTVKQLKKLLEIRIRQHANDMKAADDNAMFLRKQLANEKDAFATQRHIYLREEKRRKAWESRFKALAEAMGALNKAGVVISAECVFHKDEDFEKSNMGSMAQTNQQDGVLR